MRFDAAVKHFEFIYWLGVGAHAVGAIWSMQCSHQKKCSIEFLGWAHLKRLNNK